MKSIRKILAAGLLVGCFLSLSLSGCNMLAWPLYVISPPAPKVTKKAECDALAGKTVAVVVYADMDTLYEHPNARIELASLVNAELNRHVKVVRTVDAIRVERYQNSYTQWSSRPIQEIGHKLGADCVLYVSLNEFSTHERGSIYLPMGRISAQVSVWDARAVMEGVDACIWHKANVSVVKDVQSGSLGNDRTLRLETQKLFAENMVRLFYDHKVPAGPGT
ncbi:MAG: hypothetical protein HQ546_01760 [Planctomycetes bacterium]|nr:hypothetical protein [Planctomycetota bacterium]